MFNILLQTLIMVIIIKKIILLLIILFLIIIFRIIYLNTIKKDYYHNLLIKKTYLYTYSLSSPRGRILDTNGNILVDNKKRRVIIYHKNKNISKNKEFYIARKLSLYLSDTYEISNDDLARYYFDKNNDIKKYLSKKEYENLKKSIITYKDAYNKAINKIKNNYIKNIDDKEKKTAKIYTLMNKDYSYDKKIILDNISDKTYFEILNLKLPGITGEYIYERYYPNKDLLKGIFGSVGKISSDEISKYKKLGYSLNDEVGKSYLEKEYENILKGTKGKYKVLKDGTLKKIKNEKQGKDITLNIDIEIEKKLDNILKEHIKNTIGKTNAEYYRGSTVLVGKPTGEVVAALSYKLDDKNNLIDTTSNIVYAAYTPGSIVKAASNTVAYHENVIEPGKKINDSCVKIKHTTKKCSYKSLGLVDDISALEKSSNYYQYINAIKIMGYKYSYNIDIKTNKESFDKYRNIFKEYGLGDYTYIDLPNEQKGIEGKIISPDLLLNLSIGQYDSYTPLQILSYINTLALKGDRYNLRLNKNKEIKLINKVDIKEENMNRITTGLYNVINKGTAKGYIKNNDGAGKTGTSETLYDKDNDELYETKTISTSFIGYMPFNDPKYTIVVISPNISSNKTKNNYKVPINRYIVSDLTAFLFEK